MSKLDELIDKLCPDGVEYKKLGEVFNYEQPSKYIVKNTEYNDEFDTPVLTAGQTFILGYTDEKKGIYEASKQTPVIIFDDFTTANKWVDFRFKVKSSAIKLLTSKNNDKYNIRYLFYILQTINYTPVEHSRQWIEKYSKFQIPVPPLLVQSEIVRILDNFTNLASELESELTGRKKQYEYYRDKLLTFGDDIPKVKLKQICDIGDGLHGTPKYSENGCYYFINGNNLCDGHVVFSNTTKKIDFNEYSKLKIDMNNKTILMSINGTIGNIAYYNNESIALGKSVAYFKIKDKNFLKGFIYYYLQSSYATSYFDSKLTGSTIKNLGLAALRDFCIPVLPLEDQRRIVDILDRFDKLCNDISDGLPAEIEARKKQYEYYRDKLLAFKPCDCEKC